MPEVRDWELETYFVSSLVTWYVAHGRDLPWRHKPTPYQVWVSELMLQQTQVVTVKSYYARWMERFPTVESLAAASLEEVLSLWAGLGYYRRARYLYEGAKYIVEQLDGRFPESVNELKKLTGIGAYTAGAIACFAFGQNVPAIDGNASRVLARYFGITGDLQRGEGKIRLESCASAVAKLGQSAIVNQAVMDLGSSLCGRVAQCEQCPLVERCIAAIHGLTESIPQKKIQIEKSIEYCAALCMTDSMGRQLLVQRSSDILLGCLWEYPMIQIYKSKSKNALHEGADRMRLPRRQLWQKWLCEHGMNIKNVPIRSTGREITHVFTHIRMHIVLDAASCDLLERAVFKPDSVYTQGIWVMPEQFEQYPMSTMMKKVLGAKV